VETELLVIERTDVEGRPGFAVRCHAGTLRIGDTLTVGIDSNGEQHSVSLRCTTISLAPTVSGEVLETNYGGAIILEGDEVGMIDQDWTLRAPATAG
jgi:hypothetical protein